MADLIVKAYQSVNDEGSVASKVGRLEKCIDQRLAHWILNGKMEYITTIRNLEVVHLDFSYEDGALIEWRREEGN